MEENTCCRWGGQGESPGRETLTLMSGGGRVSQREGAACAKPRVATRQAPGVPRRGGRGTGLPAGHVGTW